MLTSRQMAFDCAIMKQKNKNDKKQQCARDDADEIPPRQLEDDGCGRQIQDSSDSLIAELTVLKVEISLNG